MNTTATHPQSRSGQEWQEFYERLSRSGTAPLWEVLGQIVPSQPLRACVPAFWSYDEVRPMLMEAGRMITAKEAERRVLILENPGARGQSRITQSLYAGLQLVLPGEEAATHRHTASALRFVIESEGGYTAVDGERTTMHPGDFILTPSWSWHDHGNSGAKPVIWLDGLDIPIVNFFDAGFFEHHAQDLQPVTRPQGDALARYGANMLPLDDEQQRPATPLFTYPYARSREALERVFRSGPVDVCHGVKMQFTNPATGSYTMPTIGAFLQMLPRGFDGLPYRSTEGAIYCVVEGRGQSRVGEETFLWKEHDVFAIPSWYAVSHQAESEAVLFSFSDRPVQKMLGIWREQAPML
ncbi:MAG: gentisate 1,2-dioxygenase [Acidobacteriia bacterium]|nr:gentisate 1,2-dioxygenase [Terriglobia bacterium]